jgi:hypothetical protein
MNNIFNTKRFGRLFIKQLAEHYKTYLMALSVLVGVMLVGGSFFVYLIPSPLDIGTQLVLFTGLYMLAGTIFTSTIFADVSDRKKAVAYLTLPATHFEKFLVGWLFSFVVYSVVYTGSFYCILTILLNLRHWPHQHIYVLNVFAYPYSSIFLVFMLLHSITICGALFFEKLHFIKTGFAFFIAVIILSLLNTSLLQALTGRDVRTTTPFSNMSFIENGKDYGVSASTAFEPLVAYIIFAVSVVFWVAAYHRLKEKQV